MYSVDPTFKNENSDVTCTSCIQGKSLYEMLTKCAKNWTAWSLSCCNRSQRDCKLTFTTRGGTPL